jgi:hypothetical protein
VRDAESRFANSTRHAGLRRLGLGGFRSDRSSARNGDGSGAPATARPSRTRIASVLLAAFAALLVFVPAAGAELGIIGYYGFRDAPEPPELGGPTDVVVNGTGAGGASPGDFYIADEGQFFGSIGKSINQYNSAGERVRLFGEDVVEKGPGQSNERQSISIFATGGSFTLTFGGETTGPIAFNASAATVQAELNALASIGGVGAAVAVSGGPGSADGSTPYLVTFTGAQGGAQQPLLQVDDSTLTGAGATSFVDSTNKGGIGKEVCELDRGDVCKVGRINYAQVGLNEVNGDIYALGTSRIERYSATGEYELAFGFDVVKGGPNEGDTDEVQSLTVKATGGTFTVGLFVPFQGFQESDPIPYNATPAQVEAAINALPVVGTSTGGAVSVTGGPGDGTGSNPYVITFTGVSAGDDITELGTNDASLTGPGKEAKNVTIQQGGEAEVCTLADVCADAESFAQSDRAGSFQSFSATLAVAPPGAPNAGNVIVGDGKRRVQEFSPDGEFIRLWGWDVVHSGPNQNREPQLIGVSASGGTFTLTFEGQTTGPIAYNAPAATIEAELNALSTIGGAGGSVTVTEGPGNSSATTPYVVTFGGTLAGTNPPFMTADPASLTGGFQRVEIGGGFAVCTAAEICRDGMHGRGLGQFSAHIEGVAVDPTGAIYVSEGRYGGGESNRINYRVQKFVTAGGLDLTPEYFGKDEIQTVTVKATGGSFRLGMIDPYGARGTGQLNGSESFEITNVNVTSGTFEVGQPIDVATARPGTRITAINGSTITINRPLTTSCGGCPLSSPQFKYTPDLPANASAAQVETELNKLAPIKALVDPGPTPQTPLGSVSVSGGPGDATGSAPYVITFDGGRNIRVNMPQLVVAPGTTPLSGGSGDGANQAVVTTTRNGGPNGQTGGISEGETLRDDSVAPLSLDVGPAGQVVVVRNYPPGWGTCEDGAFASREVRVEEFDSSGEFLGISKPCTGIEQPEGGSDPVPQISFNLATNTPYMFNAEGATLKPDGTCCEGSDKVYLLGDPGQRPDLVVNAPSNLSPTGATISGTIDPNGPGPSLAAKPANTTYRVEYKQPSDSAWQVYAPDVSVGVGDSPVAFNVGISGLTPKAEYIARVIVTKPFGFAQVLATTAPFTTLAAAPQINSVTADHITGSSADLHAVINPLGTATSYHFEYGPTPAYGQRTPEVDIGDSLSPVEVEQHIEDLEPVVYHFKVVATNAEGTVESTNQTFNFYPEPCPNATVRQQTGSGSLPDCRAYELVSPGNAGAATLLPGGPNSGLASNPPRFAFFGALGSIPGPWNPTNTFQDLYVSSRTATGWKTRYAGIPGDLVGATTGPPNGEGHPTGGEGSHVIRGGQMTDVEMNYFLGWDPGTQGFVCCGRVGSMAPYVHDFEGNSLGRWPTNAHEIEGGLKDMACWTNYPEPACGPTGGFAGDVRPSGDFSHYFFSSGNVAFAPGGKTSGIGSVYDNEIATKTVEVVSKKQNGEDIEREPGVSSDDYMALPGASLDGSNILMAASATGICGRPSGVCDPMPFPCGSNDAGFEHSLSIVNCPPLPPSHLYMRVNNIATYDVSRGHAVNFEDITEDGETVFFTSDEQVSSEDEDNSTDLFMWEQETDSVTLVADGEGTIGNTDACNASWIAACGVQMAFPRYPEFIETIPTDKSISQDGDIYFYSPEQFVGSNGAPGRRNLYVLHDGEIQYVATMDATKPATRLQVGRDGSFAAFLTSAKLTAYDNQGREEMYRYNAETGDFRCVSCLPTGEPPTADVEGSQNGLYLADDGRTFFSTKDALVPQDTNNLSDVYEYVSGRARLISTGIGQKERDRNFTSGLIGVSADAVDVYFSTFETLVPEDQNGPFLKFYDARTGGGYPINSSAAPCAAADECHGAGNPVTTAPQIGSTADLGQRGNVKPKKPAKKCKKGKVKRKGKCVKKKKKKGKKKGKRAGSTGGNR